MTTKKTSFESLRLNLGATAMGAFMLAGAGIASRAQAAAVNITATNAFIVGQISDQFDASSSTSGVLGALGFGMTEASYTAAVSTEAGVATPSDAYDGCHVLSIAGTAYKDPDGIVDYTGTTLTTDPATLSGLNVQRQFYFHPTALANDTYALRMVDSFTNPTAAPISVTATYDCNLGSDSNTAIHASSSGNTAVENADTWFVSYQTIPSDVVNSFGRFQTGAAVTPLLDVAHTPATGNDDFVDGYPITVPAGKTVRIMRLAGFNHRLAKSATDAPIFGSLASLATNGLMVGVSLAQQKEIVNYNPPAPVGAPSNLDATKAGAETVFVRDLPLK
ncbi:MAG: hypothetical protein PHR16_05695 [Methylovulum sp.]|nr:hypothetical protein [Methylovulum sp.]